MFKKSKIALGFLTGRYAFTGPKRIIVDICNECGLGCIMCPIYSPLVYDDRQKKGMWENELISLDNFKLLLEDIKLMDVREIGICGGGEPFLHLDVFKMISMVKSLGLECMVFTNGIHLDKEKISLLSNLRLDRLFLSLHAGDPITYRKIHPKAEDSYFEKIRDWLKYLKYLKEKEKRTFPKIWLRSVIISYNYDKIDQIINFGIQNNVDFIQFKIADLPGGGRLRKELSMDEFQLQKLIDALNLYKKELSIPNNIDFFVSTLVKKNDYEKSQIKVNKVPTKRTLCFTPWSSSIIRADGAVLGCTYNQKVLGNINKERFSKIWNSYSYSEFRSKLDCGGPCSAAAFSRPLNYIYRLSNFKKD